MREDRGKFNKSRRKLIDSIHRSTYPPRPLKGRTVSTFIYKVMNVAKAREPSRRWLAIKRFQVPSRPAAMLIERPRMVMLKKKLSMDCARTIFRIDRDITEMSEVCAATAMVYEKYEKSQ